MGKSALELRQDIARIRMELDDTLDELGDHVRPRRIYERKTQRLRSRFTSMRESVMGSAKDAASGTQDGLHKVGSQVGDTVSGVADKAREAPEMVVQQTRGNPLAAGLVVFGAGLVLGSLAPTTEPEQRTVSALGDKLEPVKEKARETAQELGSEVKDAAREAVQNVKDESQSAMEEVKSQAQDSAEELKDQAKTGATEVRDEARSSQPRGY
jgi:gas vesicle protein